MTLPGRYTVVTDADRYRDTEPMGRHYTGRYASAPSSYPNSARESLRPTRISYTTAPQPENSQNPTLQQNFPNFAPPSHPSIAEMATARYTERIYREMVYIRWLLLFITLAVACMLFCAIEIALRLNGMTSLTAGHF